jgi:hypothetical protein
VLEVIERYLYDLNNQVMGLSLNEVVIKGVFSK